MNFPSKQSVETQLEVYKKRLITFLQEIVRIKSLDNYEGEVVARVKQEMEALAYDEITIDPMGNIIGRMGNGSTVIAMDGHLDVVDVGDISQWSFPPFSGDYKDGKIWGRGSTDQKGGVSAMVYAARIMKDLDLLNDLTILVTGTVNEEDCDGLCWQYLINEDKIRPEFAVITEPTDGKVCRGQKGRMALKITTKGVSAHGSVPEQGENAIYKMAPIIRDIQVLNESLPSHPELGKGTITISQIFFSSASSCAVADGCTIILDRRLTYGETREQVIDQLKSLEGVIEMGAQVEIIMYDIPTYTGLQYPSESYFPSWITPEDHGCVQAAVKAHSFLFDTEPVVDKWIFSTNGVAISGLNSIPCVGYGPGITAAAHKVDEVLDVDELMKAALMYVMIPQFYLAEKQK